MTGLITDIAVLRDLLQSRVPDVCLHIDQCGLPWAVITTKWLICLFAEVLPIETVLRIWDCIFLEGYKVRSLFAVYAHTTKRFYSFQKSNSFQILFRVALTLIIRHKNEILTGDDISALADLFRGIVKNDAVTNCHEFINSIFIVPGKLTRRDIERLRIAHAATTVR